MKSLKFMFTLVMIAISATALAGYEQPAPVIVDLDERFAQGDMMSARWSKGDEVLIGCGMRSFEGGFSFGFCQATDDEGDNFVCNTIDPSLIESMRAIADDSFITFSWNEFGECTRIGFSTQSFYHQKDNPSFTNKKS